MLLIGALAQQHSLLARSTQTPPSTGGAVAAASEAMARAYGPYTDGWKPAEFSPQHSHKGRYLCVFEFRRWGWG